jgi:hypothetical protein
MPMTKEHLQCDRRATGRKLPVVEGQGHYSAPPPPADTKDGGHKATEGAPNTGMASSP